MFPRREFLKAQILAGAASVLGAVPRLDGSPLTPFNLGIITDEISENLDQALDFITHYSLGYCELRERV